jgi:hypothetical protein
MNTTLAIFFGLAIIFGVVNGLINPGPPVKSSKNLISFLFWDN